MYRKLFLSVLVSTIFLGCGNSSDPVVTEDNTHKTNTPGTSKTSGDNNKPDKRVIGYVVDSPIWGLEYSCKGQKTKFTDKNGKFECEELPATFKVGNLIVGHVGVMPKDKKIYPQDIVGVSRSEIDDKDVVKLTRFLQTLDDDGDIDEVIKIAPKIVDEFKDEKQVEIALLDTKSMSALVQKNIGREIVTKEEATKHLRKNVVDGKKPTAIEVILPDEIADGLSGEAVVNGIYDIENGTIKSQITDKITFTSSNPSVAKIDGSGKILALNEGSTEIEARFGELKATSTLKISHPTLTKIEIKKPTMAELTAVSYGRYVQFRANGFYSVDNLVKDISRQVVWSSKSPLLSSLLSSGELPYHESIEGNASILATLFDITDKAEFEIKKYDMTKLKIDMPHKIPLGMRINKNLFGFYEDESNTTYDYESSKLLSEVAKWEIGDINILDVWEPNDKDEPYYHYDDKQYYVAKTKGKTTLSVKYKNLEDNITITVTDPIVSSLSFDVDEHSLDVNETIQAKIIGHYTDNTTKDITKKVQFKSLNPTIIKVSSDGNITALKSGYGTVEVTYMQDDTNITKTNTFSVNAKPIAINIKMQDKKYSEDEIPLGASRYLEIGVSYDNEEAPHQSVDPNNIVWEIVDGSDVARLNVDYYAYLTTFKKGEVTIKATMDNLSTTKTFKVTDPVIESFNIELAERGGYYDERIFIGKSKKFKLVARYSDNSKKDINENVTWKLASKIATVTEDGNVTALNEGRTRLTATYKGESISIDIRIEKIRLKYIKIQNQSGWTSRTENNITKVTKQLSVKGYYNNEEEKDITDHLTWESSDTNVATVDENGLVTAKNQGSTEITVKYVDERENISLQDIRPIFVDD